MKPILDFLKGKKTYLVVAVAFILGGLQAIGVEVPAWVLPMLAGLGLATLRAGVAKVE